MQKFPKVAITRCLTLLLLLYGSSSYAELLLNGIATHTRFGQEQFLAAVYATTLTSDDAALLQSTDAKALEVRIIDQQIFPRRFQRMWIEGVAINASDQELEQYAQIMADFSNMLTIQLRPGDIFRMENDPASGMVVSLNDVPLGQIDDPGFINLLLRSWIGSVPLSSDFKAFLLAAGTVDSDLRRRFTNLVPSEERKSLIVATLDGTAAQPSAQQSATVSAPPSSPMPTLPATPPATETPLTVNQVELANAAAFVPDDAQETAPSVQSRSDDISVIAASDNPNRTTAVTSPPQTMTTAALMRQNDRATPSRQIAPPATSAESILSEQRYLTQLITWTQSFAKYPKRALRRGREGTVRLTVTINRYGEVKRIDYEEKSRFDLLNEAAEQAIKDASPYPSLPEGLEDREFQFTVPITFHLQ